MNPIRPEPASEPLLALGKVWRRHSPYWTKEEDLQWLIYFNQAFPKEAALSLTMEHLSSLESAYSDALSFHILLGNMEVLKLNKDFDKEKLAIFKKRIENSPIVTLDIKLDKTRLFELWFGQVPEHVRPFLYLFPDALARFLSEESITGLEDRLWAGDTGNKIIILLPDHDIQLKGSSIAVLGEKNIINNKWRSVIPKKRPDTQIFLNMFNSCQDAVKWQIPWLKYLTPIHFKLDISSPENDPITSAIRILLTNLIILYTADRTVDKEGAILSTFAGAQQSVVIGWGKSNLEEYEDHEQKNGEGISARTNSKEEHRNKYLEFATPINVEALFNLLTWAYHPEWSPIDRLPLAQISVVQAIKVSDPKIAYTLLLQNAVRIFDGLQWHWKAFMEKSIDGYIEQVHALENLVSETIRSFADQVSEVIKSLSDTMLAFVAVFLGTFIAALFETEFKESFFRIGMLVYAGYLLLFPLAYNMLNQYGRFKALETDFEARRISFESRIFKDPVKKIIDGKINKSKTRFIKWFWVTVAIYFAVFSFAIYAAYVLPDFLQ